MMELVLVGLIGINLLGLWALNAKFSAFASNAVDPEALKRSVKDTVKTTVAKSFTAPVDTDAYIEHIIKTLQAGKSITTKSRVADAIVRYVADETFGSNVVCEEPNWVDDGDRTRRIKSTDFYLQENN